MDYYKKIMEAEAKGFGDFLDRRLKSMSQKIPPFFKKKYGYGYHTSVALLRTGTMPGHDKKTIQEIIDDINKNLGMDLKISFIAASATPRIQHYFKIDFKELPYPKGRRILGPRKKETTADIETKIYERRGSEYGICMVCDLKFKIDRKSHPANLCACTKCVPNGVGYSQENHKSESFSHARQY